MTTAPGPVEPSVLRENGRWAKMPLGFLLKLFLFIWYFGGYKSQRVAIPS